VAQTATGAAILGHPLHALVHLSEHLARRGERLPAGAVVLAGALTDAVPVRPGGCIAPRSAGSVRSSSTPPEGRRPRRRSARVHVGGAASPPPSVPQTAAPSEMSPAPRSGRTTAAGAGVHAHPARPMA
jgi:hypothetical protein